MIYLYLLINFTTLTQQTQQDLFGVPQAANKSIYPSKIGHRRSWALIGQWGVHAFTRLVSPAKARIFAPPRSVPAHS